MSNSLDPDQDRNFVLKGYQQTTLVHVGKELKQDILKAWVDPERGQGIQTPLKNHKNIGFLYNTGPYPLKNHKATKTAFNVTL